MTSNNTIEGTEYKELPSVRRRAAGSPDTSSDMFSRPIDVVKHALIYSGAQKTWARRRHRGHRPRDLLQRSQKSLPTMLNYAVQAETGRCKHAAGVRVYAVGLVMKWLLAQGGLARMRRRERAEAGKLYTEIERTGSTGARAHKECRFADERHVSTGDRGSRETVHQGIDGGRARRTQGSPVGRWERASIYNAFPEEGVDALVSFMREFERTKG